jgi:hypothetical protein
MNTDMLRELLIDAITVPADHQRLQVIAEPYSPPSRTRYQIRHKASGQDFGASYQFMTVAAFTVSALDQPEQYEIVPVSLAAQEGQ